MDIHICSFASEVCDLTKKQRRDPDAVFRCLEKDPKISTFEMDETLWIAVQILIKEGRIKEVESDYPWHRYEVAMAQPEG